MSGGALMSIKQLLGKKHKAEKAARLALSSPMFRKEILGKTQMTETEFLSAIRQYLENRSASGARVQSDKAKRMDTLRPKSKVSLWKSGGSAINRNALKGVKF